METEPNAQLVLIWLLDYLGPQSKTLNIILRHVDASLVETEPMRLAGLKFPGVAINDHHLEIASLAWQAFRAPTPRAWFNHVEQGSQRSCRSFGDAFGKCSRSCRVSAPAWHVRIENSGIDRGGLVHPFEVFPHSSSAFSAAVRLLGSGRAPGWPCARAEPCCVRPRGVAVHAGDAQ